MKITSTDLEDYVYSVVVAPLKELNTVHFDAMYNPFELIGRNAYLHVEREGIDGDFAHRYERHMAEEKADLLIYFKEGYNSAVIGRLNRKTRQLKLYYDVCDKHSIVPFMSKIYHMFDATPRYKVTVERKKDAYQRNI